MASQWTSYRHEGDSDISQDDDNWPLVSPATIFPTSSDDALTPRPEPLFFQSPSTRQRVDSYVASSDSEDPIFSPSKFDPTSPTTSVAQTPSSFRSRAQSIASSFSENSVNSSPEVASSLSNLGELVAAPFQRKRGEKRERKAVRKQAGKPDQPNILDKPETQKVEKWWDLCEGQDRTTARHVTNEPSAPYPRYPSGLDQFDYQSAVLEAIARPPSPPSSLRSERTIRGPTLPLSPYYDLATVRRRKDQGLPLPFGMDASRLAPTGRTLADQQDKARRVKDAQDMYQDIERNAERSGTNVPPYEFLELIGKGAFGRVYKCQDKKTGNLVAVKIVNIDEQDWSEGFSPGDRRDQTIIDFKKEVSILQQLKDNKAQNVNVIHDAFDWHSQLWIVSDYCTGGSVRTLMRPFEKNGKPQGLPEKYIIPIARELALAMKAMHDLHIIHRDIKCANVYITEDGEIQLGDFGIVGVIDNDNTKRKTVIGTPHWMPREIVESLGADQTREGYGNEVDIWSYGCTIFEMATGSPPYSNIFPEHIPQQMEASPPRLKEGDYSDELRDFVTFCLNPDKQARPTAAAILEHLFIVNTSKRHPASDLIKLIESFKIWEHGGGSRASLWMASPSDPRNMRGDDDTPSNHNDEIEDWNFSTSDGFDQAFTRRYSQMPAAQTDEWIFDAPAGSGLPPLDNQSMSIEERVKQEHSEKSANRGKNFLAPIYDPNDPEGYKVATPVESPPLVPAASAAQDLPLRDFTEFSRESMIEIDLNDADADDTATSTFARHMSAISEDTIKPAGRHNSQDDDDDDNYQYGQQDKDKRATMEWTFATAATPKPNRGTLDWTFLTAQAAPPALPALPALPDLPALKPKRGTMDWTFEDAEPAPPEEPEFPPGLPSAGYQDELPPGFRPHIKHATTEPVGHFRGFSHSTGTGANSPNRDSMASLIDLDAGLADLVRDEPEVPRPSTATSQRTDMTSGNPFDLEDDEEQKEADRNRFSYHKQWRSEGGRFKRNSHKTMAMHERGSSLSSTASELQEPQSAVEGSFAFPTSMHQGGMNYSMIEQGLGMGGDDAANSHWLQFPNYGPYDTSPQYLPTSNDVQIPRIGEPGFPLEPGLRMNGAAGLSRSRAPSHETSGPEIDFPSLQPPHLSAMTEDADDYVLEEEMNRVLTDLNHSLTSVTRALSQHASIDDDFGDISSDIDSGFDSNRDVTEDEADRLTARRKPRKLEMRSSPRLPAPETFDHN